MFFHSYCLIETHIFHILASFRLILLYKYRSVCTRFLTPARFILLKSDSYGNSANSTQPGKFRRAQDPPDTEMAGDPRLV